MKSKVRLRRAKWSSVPGRFELSAPTQSLWAANMQIISPATITIRSNRRFITEVQMSIVTMSEPRRPSSEFEEMFRQHAPLVYRTAYGVTGSHEDAEDILQTIFMRLIRRELSPDI